MPGCARAPQPRLGRYVYFRAPVAPRLRTRTDTETDLARRTDKYQLEIVKNGGLPPLLRLLRSSFLPLILSAAACVRNVSIHPDNESPIIDSGFLSPLIDLLAYDENEEIQCHAISTLRNLAASSEANKRAIVDAGAALRIKELVLTVPIAVQSEMTACAAVLGLSGALPALRALMSETERSR